MPPRYFTVDEARGLVPWLVGVFGEMAPMREKAQRLTAETEGLLGRMRHNGGSDSDEQLDLKRRAIKEASDFVADRLESINERGILVKGMDPGLVDFPSMWEGREVYLCWLEGDEELGFWHEVEAGFAGRQPL
jgi:hypothetical protein